MLGCTLYFKWYKAISFDIAFMFPLKMFHWTLCVFSFNFYTKIVFECYKSAETQDGDKIV